jgi:hypothetical protein
MEKRGARQAKRLVPRHSADRCAEDRETGEECQRLVGVVFREAKKQIVSIGQPECEKGRHVRRPPRHQHRETDGYHDWHCDEPAVQFRNEMPLGEEDERRDASRHREQPKCELIVGRLRYGVRRRTVGRRSVDHVERHILTRFDGLYFPTSHMQNLWQFSWAKALGDVRTASCLGALLALASSAPADAQGTAATLAGTKVKVTVSGKGATVREQVQILNGQHWIDALDTNGPVLIVGGRSGCGVADVQRLDPRIVVRGECAEGFYERQLQLGPDDDLISVSVRYTPRPGKAISSVEDRLTFAPMTHDGDTPEAGPLDFVWSQNIKASQDQLTAHWAYKSPAVQFQQGRVFSAIIPRLDLLTADSLTTQPTALDLAVAPRTRAWFSYGAVSGKPTGHSYFQRTVDVPLSISGPIEYQYWILASAQPERLGYRRVTELMWQKFGHPSLIASLDLQRNVKRPELFLFDDWRREAWSRYADEKYWEADCGGKRCGALTSNRNPWGKWDDAPREDAWFNSWFQNLRTAYGWYMYAQNADDMAMKRKAEQVLNLALTSPRDGGAFSTIYLNDTKTWLREDGWAGFVNDYHTFCMSWTGYWMLRWATDLVPERKAEVMAFLKPYADFLLTAQLGSGAIPSWFDESLTPRPEFRDFNAETAGSALFLASFADASAEPKYRDAALRAQEFITRDVLPRQRWYDFETFLSCARKPFDFYDRWTSQYPQNNLSTMQAAQAYLSLYKSTKKPELLETGERVVDYLLLTQQVWNHPLLSPKLLGGTTTQNTDAEWSDARQCYLAALLLDYYRINGRLDYLERAVAAARSGFAVAPWENWAHMGHDNEPGALTGIHWGTGSQMATVEMMSGFLGDAFVDVPRKQGVGFNASNVKNLSVADSDLTFDVETADPSHATRVRFAGIDLTKTYRLTVNGKAPVDVKGEALAAEGYSVER